MKYLPYLAGALLLTAATPNLTAQARPQNVQIASTQFQKDIKVSLKDVLTALKETFPEATLTSIDLSAEYGKYVYQVEAQSQSTEYELHIDAESGAIIYQESLPEEDDDYDRKFVFQLDKLLPLNDINTAVSKADSDAVPYEWELDHNRQTAYWKVEASKNQMKITLYFDAYTGAPLQMKD